MDKSDMGRFTAAIESLTLCLRGGDHSARRVMGYWYGLHEYYTIDEVEAAVRIACRTLDWQPTPHELAGIIKSQVRRPAYYIPPPRDGVPMPEGVRAQMEALLRKWEDHDA